MQATWGFPNPRFIDIRLMTMLDREQLLKALEELEKELAEQKVRVELFIVG